MNLKVRFIPEIDPTEIYNCLKGITRERVAFNVYDKETKYIGAFIDEKLIAVVGYQFLKNGEIRYKTDFLLPQYRGKGIYRKLFEYRDFVLLGGEAQGTMTKRVTAFCTEMSLNTYLHNGFKIVNRMVNGITFVEKVFN